MNFKALISVPGLVQFINHPDWLVVDCRFSLEDPDQGYRDYLQSHIPGALYAHLEEHLSGKIIPGKTGRHPLPDDGEISALFSRWGIGDETQVVAYDDKGGKFSGRLWWLLKWLGHENVAVLDGGLPAWIESGQVVTDVVTEKDPKVFTPRPRTDMTTTADTLLHQFGDPNHLMVDSRAPHRYQGVLEPIDPVAGRIPGAVNSFWSNNLDSQGHFVAKDILRGRFEAIFQDIPSRNITFYCGSGVTAAHNILAMYHAGLGMAKLYPGSWSHWITDPERPIAKEK